MFFFQNHARTEDFSWEFSDCKRCKFLCRKMRISWKIDEGLDLWMCFFLGGGRGEKISLVQKFWQKIYFGSSKWHLFWCYSRLPTGIINKHVGYIQHWISTICMDKIGQAHRMPVKRMRLGLPLSFSNDPWPGIRSSPINTPLWGAHRLVRCAGGEFQCTLEWGNL